MNTRLWLKRGCRTASLRIGIAARESRTQQRGVRRTDSRQVVTEHAVNDVHVFALQLWELVQIEVPAVHPKEM